MRSEYKRPFEVDPVMYLKMFQEDKGGAQILQELAFKFYDRSSVVAGDPYATHEREGERNVVRFILQKCADAQAGEGK